jgi:AAHS family 4-hydroxybenzoate transporter-like MFS transporter
VPVLSAALIGAAIGAIVLGPLADRLGRKTLLLFSVFIFSCSCLLSSFAQNVTQLEILRFITGLGLGAATGGFAAAYIVPHFGWEGMLLLSGALPLLLAMLMAWLLPESVRYLLLNGADQSRIQHILQKINALALQQSFRLEAQSRQLSALQSMRMVFSSKFLAGTLSLWLCFFCGLMIFYSIINWMPVLFKEADMPPHLGPVVSGLFALGGVGAILNGWLMDHFNGNYVIAVCTFFTAICVALIGPALHLSLTFFIILMICAGTLQNTAQSSLPVLAAKFYPTAVRTTGVSWMCGIGRFGAVAGTMCMGYLVNHNIGWSQIFTILAIPAAVMTLCMLIKNMSEAARDSARFSLSQQDAE